MSSNDGEGNGRSENAGRSMSSASSTSAPSRPAVTIGELLAQAQQMQQQHNQDKQMLIQSGQQIISSSQSLPMQFIQSQVPISSSNQLNQMIQQQNDEKMKQDQEFEQKRQRQQQQLLAQQQLQRLQALQQQQQLCDEEKTNISEPATSAQKGVKNLPEQQLALQQKQQQVVSGRPLMNMIQTSMPQKQQYIVTLPGGKTGKVAMIAGTPEIQQRLLSQQVTPQQQQQQRAGLQTPRNVRQQMQPSQLLKTPDVRNQHRMTLQQQSQSVQRQVMQVAQGQTPVFSGNNAVQYKIIQGQGSSNMQAVNQQRAAHIHVSTPQQQTSNSVTRFPSAKRQRKSSTPDVNIRAPGSMGDIRLTTPSSTWSSAQAMHSAAQQNFAAGDNNSPRKNLFQTEVTYSSTGGQPTPVTQHQLVQHHAKQQLMQVNQRLAKPERMKTPQQLRATFQQQLQQAAASPNMSLNNAMTPQSLHQQQMNAINGNVQQQSINAPRASGMQQSHLTAHQQLSTPRPPGVQSTPNASSSQAGSQGTPVRQAQNPDQLSAAQMGGMGSNLVIGEEYVIQYSNGRKVVGTWDGKFFKIKPPVSGSAVSQGNQQPSSSEPANSGHVAGGGANNTKSSQQNNNGSVGNPMEGSPWQQQHLQTATADKLLRPPLHPEEQQKPKRPPRPTEDGKFAVCNKCGAYSADYDICEGCKRTLPDDVKYYIPEPKKARTELQQSQQTALQGIKTPGNVDKKTFYGNKVGEQSGIHYGAPVRKTAPSKSGPNRKTPSKRKVKGRSNEIETVTILSSGDEDESSNHSKCSESSQAASSQQAQSSVPGVRSQQTHNNQQVAVQAAKQIKQMGMNMRLPPGIAGLLGNLPQQSSIPDVPLQPGTTVLVKTRSIRIGSLKTASSDPVSLNTQGISFVLQLPDATRLQVLLPAKELTSVLAYFGRAMPVLFVHVSSSCASKIRTVFNMKPGSEPYFDPDSKRHNHKRITFLLSAMTDQVHSTMLQICHHIQLENHDFSHERLLIELDHEAANTILVQSTTSMAHVGDDDDEEGEPMDRSRSPSPPRVFCGEIVKLFTYPPAPATGGITVTNEDLFCLNDGEFLNDVIIDFYLKYLFIDQFSKEDQDRTHIFSSFFYRRLTQKQNRRGDENLNMTPAERRHSRVRTWTRHVDIFDKDFIIVPINESAHWYLAIICFPGLREPIRAEPSSESEGQDLAGKGEEKMDTEDNQKTEAPAKKEKKSSKIFKQPCILLFDSLSGPSRTSVVRTLREYLQVEWEKKKKMQEGARVFDKDTFKGGTVKSPQQQNFSDCGVYLLQYVESFFQSPPENYNIPMDKENWFPDEVIMTKREELRGLIMDLMRELNPNLDYDPATDGCQVGALEDEGPEGHEGSTAPHVVTEALAPQAENSNVVTTMEQSINQQEQDQQQQEQQEHQQEQPTSQQQNLQMLNLHQQHQLQQQQQQQQHQMQLQQQQLQQQQQLMQLQQMSRSNPLQMTPAMLAVSQQQDQVSCASSTQQTLQLLPTSETQEQDQQNFEVSNSGQQQIQGNVSSDSVGQEECVLPVIESTCTVGTDGEGSKSEQMEQDEHQTESDQGGQ